MHTLAVSLVMASVAEVALLAGRFDEAEAAVEESTSGRLPGLLAFSAAANAQIQRGRLAAIQGDHAKAVEVADQVLAWLRPLEVRPYDADALLLKGNSLTALGRTDEAERVLLEGRDEAEKLGFAPIVWRIDMALCDIASAAGDRGRSVELRDRARRVIERLAASIDEEDLRASFLASPDVRAVVADGTLAP